MSQSRPSLQELFPIMFSLEQPKPVSNYSDASQANKPLIKVMTVEAVMQRARQLGWRGSLPDICWDDIFKSVKNEEAKQWLFDLECRYEIKKAISPFERLNIPQIFIDSVTNFIIDSDSFQAWYQQVLRDGYQSAAAARAKAPTPTAIPLRCIYLEGGGMSLPTLETDTYVSDNPVAYAAAVQAAQQAALADDIAVRHLVLTSAESTPHRPAVVSVPSTLFAHQGQPVPVSPPVVVLNQTRSDDDQAHAAYLGF